MSDSHARFMAATGRFTHTQSPTPGVPFYGATAWDAAVTLDYLRPVSQPAAVGHASPAAVVDAFSRAMEHRVALLYPGELDVGGAIAGEVEHRFASLTLGFGPLPKEEIVVSPRDAVPGSWSGASEFRETAGGAIVPVGAPPGLVGVPLAVCLWTPERDDITHVDARVVRDGVEPVSTSVRLAAQPGSAHWPRYPKGDPRARNVIWYSTAFITPTEPLRPGRYRADVTVRRSRGGTQAVGWEFTVEAR